MSDDTIRTALWNGPPGDDPRLEGRLAEDVAADEFSNGDLEGEWWEELDPYEYMEALLKHHGDRIPCNSEEPADRRRWRIARWRKVLDALYEAGGRRYLSLVEEKVLKARAAAIEEGANKPEREPWDR